MASGLGQRSILLEFRLQDLLPQRGIFKPAGNMDFAKQSVASSVHFAAFGIVNTEWTTD
jgi:hypothetical protein